MTTQEANKRTDAVAEADPKSALLSQELNAHADHLTNGSKGNLDAMSVGIATSLRAQVHVLDKLGRIPERPEIREMITSHAATCALARADGGSTIEFGVGNRKFRAAGKATLWVAVGAVVVLVAIGPYLASIVSSFRSTKEAQDTAKVLAEKVEKRAVEVDRKLDTMDVLTATNVVPMVGLRAPVYVAEIRTLYVPEAPR